MLRRPKPRKSSCPPYSRIANSLSDLCPSNKRTTSVLLQWRHRWKCRKTTSTFCASGRGAFHHPWLFRLHHHGAFLEARLLLLRVVVPVMTWRLHSLRLDVAAIQQQLHLLRAPMWVHSHERVRAPVATWFWISVSFSFSPPGFCLTS
jgi:hypothetical protein